MIGDPRQQRARGHIGERMDFAVGPAFTGELFAEELDRRVFDPAGEIEQHAVRPEIGQRVGIEFLNRGKVAVVEQAGPMVVGAHLHAPFVLPDRAGRQFGQGFLLAEFHLGPVVAGI